MRVLLTGGCGFIGAHIVEGILKETDWSVVILDRLDLSGNLERLRDIDVWEKEKSRVKFVWWDLKSELNSGVREDIGNIDYILHLAASSHVDRSIDDPMSFVMDNVVGTTNLLLFARNIKVKKTVYFSTDEVFGPAEFTIRYKEWDRYNSSNPYAASKAGGEEMAIAFANTYKMPIIITHTMNVFGERQHPEKFIPKVIRMVQKDEVVPIHANRARLKSGSRYWIHARNVTKALLYILENGECLDGSGKQGKYNIVGEREISNLDMARFIADIIGKEGKYEMIDFHSSRPGHDLRYALNGELLEELGFKFPKTFDKSLTNTIKWYLSAKNKKWLTYGEKKD